jgi:hypothetical protein
VRTLCIFLIVCGLFSCQKEKLPPALTLKTGTGYTTSDFFAAPGTSFVVGIDASQTTDELDLFYTEVGFDGANTNQLVSRIYVPSNEREHFVRDITVTLRNQVGTERWVFNINDADGRITKREIKVTVQ